MKNLQFIIKTIKVSTVSIMLRITRVLKMIKPCILNVNPLSKPFCLLYKNFNLFSEISKNKIFQLVQDEKVMNNLNEIAQQMRELQEPEKAQLFSVILQKILEGQLSSKIIQNQNILTEFKKHPQPHFDITYHRIQQNLHNLEQQLESGDYKMKKILTKQISDSFLLCFEILKKIQAKNAAPRELQLLRTFAEYNFKFLSQLVEPNKNNQVINKSRECYKLILSKITSLLKRFSQEQAKFRSQNNVSEERKKLIQNEYIQLAQTRFMMIEQYSEIVEEMFTNQQELQQQRQEKLNQMKGRVSKNQERNEQQQFQYSKQALVLQPYLVKAIQNYKIIPDIYLQSNYLYKLKKKIVQLQNERQMRSVLASRKTEEEKQTALKQIQIQLTKDYDQLYSENQAALKDIKKQQKMSEEELAEIMMSMFTTRVHKFAEQITKNHQDELLRVFGIQVQKLVNLISNQTLRKKVLVLMVQEIKDKLGLKIDNFVQKMARNIRTQRRVRKLTDK